MRRLTRAFAALAMSAALLASANCNRRRTALVETVEEQGQQLMSVVHVADPNASIQLVRGFHDIEQNAWRWTRGSFAVTLKVPPGAAEKGAVLELRFVAPDPVIDRVKELQLAASVEGHAIEPETYSRPGEYTYSRELPATALANEAVTVEFTVDKFLAAGEVEPRELAVIVSSIGLMGK